MVKADLLYKIRSGKNSKAKYYCRSYIRQLRPTCLFRHRLRTKLQGISARSDAEYIFRRINYYNKLQAVVQLPDKTPTLAETHVPHKQKVYYFDSYEYLRWFPCNMHWLLCPGDITYVPKNPSLLKSRPIKVDNENAVLLNLNKIRHFIFVNDKNSFSEKKDLVVFRGKVQGKEQRERFMQLYFGDPIGNFGDTSSVSDNPPEWCKGKMTIREQLSYRYIMALEGNDVASNLKWIMSSNSIAVMPKPTYETWFMEGRLIPNYHYIEIKADFSDLAERLHYYSTHMDEAQQIIENAH